MNRAAALLAAAAATLTLAGCRAEVATDVEVTGVESATVTVSAVFTDEAAAALSESTQARSELNELFKSRIGVAPKITIGKEKFTATAKVPYSKVGELTEITGVSYLVLDEEGTRARVGFAPATKLVETITAQNANEPDAAALTTTMLENTFLVVGVEYGGGVTEAEVQDTSGVEVEKAKVDVDGDRAEYTRTAADESTGQLVVNGDLSDNLLRNIALGGGALLLLGGAFTWLRRR